MFGSALSSAAVVKVGNPVGGWLEDVDAGDTLANAQITAGSGGLSRIDGSLPDGGDGDLYKIVVTNFAGFSAIVTAPAEGDSRLALFDAQGKGVVFNDDASDASLLSAIDYATSKQPAANGIYYLGIMTQGKLPASTVGGASASIWTTDNPTSQKTPDGPGAANPLAGFDGDGGSLVNYSILLTGAAYAVEDAPPELALNVRRSGANVVLAWPAADSSGFALQAADALGANAAWQAVSTAAVATNGENTVTLPRTGKAHFFRLIRR